MADKTLVVIGYHSDELEWGTHVKETFEKEHPDSESVKFLVIEDSPVKTGLPSPEVDKRIRKAVEEEGDVKLMIDIHSDIQDEYAEENGENHLSYTGIDSRKVDRINEVYPSEGHFPTAKVIKGAPLDIVLTKGTQVEAVALSETYLTKTSFQDRDDICRGSEEKVAEMIHALHRMHVCEKLSPDSIRVGESAIEMTQKKNKL